MRLSRGWASRLELSRTLAPGPSRDDEFARVRRERFGRRHGVRIAPASGPRNGAARTGFALAAAEQQIGRIVHEVEAGMRDRKARAPCRFDEDRRIARRLVELRAVLDPLVS